MASRSHDLDKSAFPGNDWTDQDWADRAYDLNGRMRPSEPGIPSSTPGVLDSRIAALHDVVNNSPQLASEQDLREQAEADLANIRAQQAAHAQEEHALMQHLLAKHRGDQLAAIQEWNILHRGAPDLNPRNVFRSIDAASHLRNRQVI